MGVNTTKKAKTLITRKNNLHGVYESRNNFIITKGRRSIPLNQCGSAAAVQKSNAVSSCNMAPALTEPLSSTEKLSSSAATATPSTRSSKKFDSTAASTSIATSSSTVIQQKEKRNRNSTRATRSNNAYQRIFEEAVTPILASDATTPPISIKESANSEEELMGLIAAPTEANHTNTKSNNNNYNNNNKIETTPDSIAADSTPCKENTTEQLLADLTNDFEEAITAEICLRKHFQNANLGKDTQSGVGHTKDILVIKAGSVGATEVLRHMESEKLKSNEVNPQEASTKEEEVQLDEQIEKVYSASTMTKSTDISISSETAHKTLASEQAIVVVEELPPMSTDSTMTASEVEDNIEERLSQLDGSVLTDTNIDENIADSSAIQEALRRTPVSPLKTPTQQDQNPQTHQQIVQQLQSQLQHVSPTPQVQSQQGIITSSVNAMLTNNFPHGTTKETVIVTASGGGGSGDIEDPDIDEVLCALKDFDGTTAGDTLCDLNVLLNEVYTTLNYEDINSQPTATTSVNKPNLLKDVQVEIEKKNQTMQRKIDFLLRRLRKLQARYMSKHAIEEIAGLFEWSARAVSRETGNTDLTQQKTATISTNPVISSRPDPNNWADEKKTPVPLAQMSTMLHKLETVANAQQLCTEPSTSNSTTLVRKTKKNAAQESFDTSSASIVLPERTCESLVPTLDQNAVEELTHVAGLLQSEMREVQNGIDSDATESSSGGESADEMVTYSNQIQQSLSIAKRAAWRYSRDRAAIASRWSWLRSQIADLEIKIRQHSELNLDVVRTKGSVVSSSDTTHADQTTAMQIQSASVNGYKGEMRAALANEGNVKIECDTEVPSSSCRTRGFDLSQFRKRKLLQTTNIHTISKKAARPSSVKCGCQWPLHPCAVCTGRVDPTAPRDLPDTMMMPDRVSLLDPGFHPVLSFPEDISSSIHLEAIARMPDWQHRVMRSQVKSIAKSLWKAERIAAASGHHSNMKRYNNASPAKRRYIKKKDRIFNEQSATTSITKVYSAASIETGNGFGTMSTTPLVANKMNRKLKRIHCNLSPVATNNSSNHSQSSNSNYIYRTSNSPNQRSELFNHNQAHSSLISSSTIKKKHRKLTKLATNHHHNNSHCHQFINNNNNTYNTNSNVGGSNEINSMHINDNWDYFGTRSRTSSPTHGGGAGNSYYPKYERSLDRKNRTSYDIDNIVIPYSVAAATRVEILHYKEIPTPKWRIIGEEDEGNDNINSEQRICTEKENIMEKEEVTEMALNEIITNGLEKDVDNTALEENLKDPLCNDVEINDIQTLCSTVPHEKKIKNNNILAEPITSEEGEQESIAKVIEEETEENSVVINQALVTHTKKENHCINNNTKTCKAESTADAENINIKPFSDIDERLCVEDEDISNEAMILRHERALMEERRKFQTYLKFPWSTRSRANRRIDSRAESSGANTPDPASPAPHTPSVGGGDQESIPSPLPPLTTHSSLDAIAETGENPLANISANSAIDKYCERRRTTSTKKEREMERRSSTPDFKEFIMPYEPLKFPLPDEVFESLVEAMPTKDYHDDTNCIDDYQSVNTKPTRNRNNSVRSNGLTKRAAVRPPRNYDATQRRKRRRITSMISHKSADIVAYETTIPNTGCIIIDQPPPPIFENGKDESEIEDDEIFDNYDENDDDDEEDDDYPQHHLAPPKNDEYQNVIDNDNLADAYDECNTMLGFSDEGGESSTTEPFQDDDPNDPEWKGESGERAEKIRRKL